MANVNRRLTAFAVAVVVGHHTGVLFKPLGAVGTTHWADWLDLGVPFAVLGLAGAVLAAADASRRDWIALGLGGVAYAQGQGIHLAANSIDRVDPSSTAHLWDEVVGHYVWYSGLVIVVATLASVLELRPRPRSVWALPLAVAFGLTFFTNSVEGGTPVLGLVASTAFLVWGLHRHETLGGLLVPVYGVALVALVAWGVYWGGFPQFSEVGWL